MLVFSCIIDSERYFFREKIPKRKGFSEKVLKNNEKNVII